MAFAPVITSVSLALTSIVAPVRMWVIFRMCCWMWKTLISSGSARIVPAICLNDRSATSFVGAISRPSASGRRLRMIAVSMMDAAPEVLLFFFGTRTNASCSIRSLVAGS